MKTIETYGAVSEETVHKFQHFPNGKIDDNEALLTEKAKKIAKDEGITFVVARARVEKEG